MLRALIAGVLAVSSVAACSKSKGNDAPTVAVSTPAGKVVEASGKVTATRDGKTRDLAIGAEVFADDQVETAADATVTIELFHNNARWAVVSNKKQRVDASLAWGLDKQQATKAVEHNSAAAGREGERSAADNSATAQATAAAAETASPEIAIRTQGATGAAPPPAPGGAAPPPPPPPSPAPEREKAADQPPRMDRSAEPSSGGGKGAPTMKAPKVEVAIGGKVDASAKLKTLVDAKRAELKKCLDPQGAQVKVNVVVKAGKATVTLEGSGNLTDKVRSCAEVVVNKLDLAGIDGSTSIDFR